MTISYPLINGRRFDFASIELHFKGQRIIGFKDITYSHELDPGEVRGSLRGLIGRTGGTYKADGSLTMFLQEYEELIGLLGVGFMEQAFDLVLMFAEEGEQTRVDKLRGCRIKKADKSFKQGNEPLEVKCDLSVVAIEEGGVSATL